MKKLWLFAVLATLMLLTACGQDTAKEETKENKKEQDGKLTVFTTVYPLTYFTERIGGDAVNVSSIYPAGANEHTFELTQKDMIALADADLFLYIGLGLEGFVDKAKSILKDEKVKFIATTNEITDEELSISQKAENAVVDEHSGETPEEHAAHADEATTDEHAGETAEEHAAHADEATINDHAGETADEHAAHTDEATTEADPHAGHNHGDIDPHVWLSPTLSKKLALSIKNELVALQPEQEATFNKNYEKLIAELDAVDKKFADMASKAKSKTFFVSHAAFGYIAGEYGLQQVAIAGLNSQSEPSQQQLAKIVTLAKELKISTIMFEQNVSSKLTEVVQKEIGAKALTLNNLGVLTQENIKNNENYFTIAEQNIEALSTALNSSGQ